MNQTLNLALVVGGPLVIVAVVAGVRWLVDRDAARLGGRLHRWGFWAAIGPYALLAAVMTLSMVVEPAAYDLPAVLAGAVLFAGLPLGAWAWQRGGGRGLGIAISAAVAALCALALAVVVDPQTWAAIQEGGLPIVSILALAVGAAAAVWGRRSPVPAGIALVIAGTVPLGMCVLGSAAADVVLVEMFAPMPMFALLGLAYLAAGRLEHAGPLPPRTGDVPPRVTGTTMTA